MGELLTGQFEALWSVEDLSAYLKIPPATIYQWRCKGYGPPARRVGRYLRFEPLAVVAWLEQQTAIA